MSNLTLPKMTYDTLRGMLSNARLKGGYKVKIAYETTIEFSSMQDQTIIVKHHGNPIAEIGRDFFTITGAGWNSRTTADRLNKILRDNQTSLPSPDSGFDDRLYYAVSSRDSKREYGLFLTAWNHSVKQHNVRDIRSNVAHFSRVDSDHHYVLHETVSPAAAA